MRIKKGIPGSIFDPGIFLFEVAMHFYWRVKEELLYLGEVLVFVDPRLMREYRRWVERALSRIRDKMN